jgi:hypothetical protein
LRTLLGIGERTTGVKAAPFDHEHARWRAFVAAAAELD